MKLAVVYCRVSTDEQEKSGTSLDTQEQACRQYAAEHGYEVLQVVREARSGATLARRGLDEVRDLVADRKVHAVIVYDPDRLSRGGLAHTYLLIEEFRAAGVAPLFVTYQLEDTPESDMLFGVTNLASQYERAKIRERTRRGKVKRAQEGTVIPGPRITFGYRYEREPRPAHYEVNEPQAVVVRLIFDLFVRECLSCSGVTTRLNELGISPPNGGRSWRRSTVHRILSNPCYSGVYHYLKHEFVVPRSPRKPASDRKREKSAYLARDKSDTIPVAVPAIIELQLFERAQQRLQANKANSPRNERRTYLLRSLVKCGRCGWRYAGQYTHGARVYVCPAKNPGNRFHKADRCTNRQYQADTLERAVWDALVTRLSDPKQLAQGMSAEERDHDTRAYEIKRLSLYESRETIEREQARLMAAYKAGAIELAEFAAERSEAAKRLDDIKSKLARLEQDHAERVSANIDAEQAELVHAWMTQVGLTNPSFADRRRLLEKLQVTITVDGESVIVSGLLTGSVIADLDFAREKVQGEHKALAAVKADVEVMRAEGRHADADRIEQYLQRSQADGTLWIATATGDEPVPPWIANEFSFAGMPPDGGEPEFVSTFSR
jgi:site-specific DNA recombinase